MTIFIGSDHGGYQLKEQLKTWLKENNIIFEDLGASSLDPNDDYPDYVLPVAQKVAANPDNLGIVLGRSGNGEVIAANKIKGIRATLCLNEKMAEKAKEHNNANVLSLGADYISFDMAQRTVKTFLDTPFSGEERHLRRLKKIEAIEN